MNHLQLIIYTVCLNISNSQIISLVWVRAKPMLSYKWKRKCTYTEWGSWPTTLKNYRSVINTICRFWSKSYAYVAISFEKSLRSAYTLYVRYMLYVCCTIIYNNSGSNSIYNKSCQVLPKLNNLILSSLYWIQYFNRSL